MNFANEYFTIHVLSSGTITFTTTTPTGSASPYIIEIDYSVNEGMWEGILSSTTGSLLGTFNTGDKIRVKGTNPLSNKSNRLYSNYFGGTAEVEVYGNILSLVHGDNFTNFNACTQIYEFTRVFYNYSNLKSAQHLVFPATCYEDCYNSMFENCTGLTIAPEQLSTTLAENCYNSMFQGCTSLLIIPPLPVTSLAPGCYKDMFRGCTSLITPPVLPATILTSYCYSDMFYGCTNLTSAPVLSATNLEPYCYANMFEGCTKLEVAPELPALVLKESCYNAMFMKCYSLKKMPELPATTLTPSCYCMMFWLCSSLETASILPATNLESYCYADMFYGCSSLTVPPELPATTLKNNCYDAMFGECYSLTQAPLLPALTLVSNCYRNMFCGCYNLKYIHALFTTTPSNSYTYDWVSGVAESGRFIKNSAAVWSVTGTNGVPVGWNINNSTYTSYTLIDPNFLCTEQIDIQDIRSWTSRNLLDAIINYTNEQQHWFILNNWYNTFPWAEDTVIWNSLKYIDHIDLNLYDQLTNFEHDFSRPWENITYIKENYGDWYPYVVDTNLSSDVYLGTDKDEFTNYIKDLAYTPALAAQEEYTLPNLYSCAAAEISLSLIDFFTLDYCNAQRSYNNITALLLLMYVYFSLTPNIIKFSDAGSGGNFLYLNKRIIVVKNELNIGGNTYNTLQHFNDSNTPGIALALKDKYEQTYPKMYFLSNNYSCQALCPITFIKRVDDPNTFNNETINNLINWQILRIKYEAEEDPDPRYYNILTELSVLNIHNIIKNYSNNVTGLQFGTYEDRDIIHGIFYDSDTANVLYILTSGSHTHTDSIIDDYILNGHG